MIPCTGGSGPGCVSLLVASLSAVSLFPFLSTVVQANVMLSFGLLISAGWRHLVDFALIQRDLGVRKIPYRAYPFTPCVIGDTEI